MHTYEIRGPKVHTVNGTSAWVTFSLHLELGVKWCYREMMGQDPRPGAADALGACPTPCPHVHL